MCIRDRVYNSLHTLTREVQMLARACGKTNIHSLEPEDLCALTVEAAAMAKVPLAGTNYIPGGTEQNTLNVVKSRLERPKDMLFGLQVTPGLDVPPAGD